MCSPSVMLQTRVSGAALLPNINKFFFNYLWGHDTRNNKQANRFSSSCLSTRGFHHLAPSCSTSHTLWKIDHVYLFMWFVVVYYLLPQRFSFYLFILFYSSHPKPSPMARYEERCKKIAFKHTKLHCDHVPLDIQTAENIAWHTPL